MMEIIKEDIFCFQLNISQPEDSSFIEGYWRRKERYRQAKTHSQVLLLDEYKKSYGTIDGRK